MTEKQLHKKKERNEKTRWVIVSVIFALIALISVSISVSLLLGNKQEDTSPPAVDSRIQKIPEASSEGGDGAGQVAVQDNAGSVDVICSETASVDTESGKIELFYQNPDNSTHGVLLELFIGEHKIAESGIIPPGYELDELELLPKVVIKPGSYAGYYQIKVVDADNGESTMVNAKVDLRITASE